MAREEATEQSLKSVNEVNCVDENTTIANANLATTADHAGRNISAYIQAELLQVQAHTGQHLEQSHFLLRGLVNQCWTGWVALWPLAVIDEMKGTAL